MLGRVSSWSPYPSMDRWYAPIADAFYANETLIFFKTTAEIYEQAFKEIWSWQKTI